MPLTENKKKKDKKTGKKSKKTRKTASSKSSGNLKRTNPYNDPDYLDYLIAKKQRAGLRDSRGRYETSGYGRSRYGVLGYARARPYRGGGGGGGYRGGGGSGSQVHSGNITVTHNFPFGHAGRTNEEASNNTAYAGVPPSFTPGNNANTVQSVQNTSNNPPSTPENIPGFPIPASYPSHGVRVEELPTPVDEANRQPSPPATALQEQFQKQLAEARRQVEERLNSDMDSAKGRNYGLDHSTQAGIAEAEIAEVNRETLEERTEAFARSVEKLKARLAKSPYKSPAVSTRTRSKMSDKVNGPSAVPGVGPDRGVGAGKETPERKGERSVSELAEILQRNHSPMSNKERIVRPNHYDKDLRQWVAKID